ncbi:ubiquinone biosynthesis mono0xygenase COQ6 [Zalerion maritima]|uniref:Ubiquinone biosynthesis monooxygenase COQ6, mitochondrial n=1 Tax=Zalerion maritima TaxID=339359 RepID=A0AAD5RV62_9PEZI|nr:ubiquinone biosynthesis mono0xygenase COQ6 [Zalerion maritima]
MRPLVSLRTPLLCHSCSRLVWRSVKGQRGYATTTTTTTASEREIYDVVCVGGGPAGLSLLTALRSNPTTSSLRIALVEAQDLSKVASWSLPQDQFSNRCSSLTPSSARFLNTIGAWSHMERSRIQAYQEMQVWDGVSGSRISFDGPSTSQDGVIAYMIENLNLQRGLLKRLSELRDGVNIFDTARVSSISHGSVLSSGHDLTSWPVVTLSSGTSLTARLLVGADGANSPVRTFADIPSRGWDYGRHGVVATLQLSDEGWGGADFKTAYQRFLPTGPIAMLPLPGPFASLVWSTIPSNAALLKSLSPVDFTSMVNAAFRLSTVDLKYMHTLSSGQTSEYSWRMEHNPHDPFPVPPPVTGVQEGTVASFPLRLRHADTYISPRVVLIGDAAHTVHPLAGQGLNAGQGDVQSLASTIEYAVSHGMDIGSMLALEKYNAERYFENHAVLGVCDKLHKLYSVGSGPVVGLRSLGLKAVSALRPVKDFLMKQASGNGFKLF